MSVRLFHMPQNGVLRRLFRAVRFAFVSETVGSASASTTSRTIRRRVLGTDFRVSTISSIEVSSLRTFAVFMNLPPSLHSSYRITSVGIRTLNPRGHRRFRRKSLPSDTAPRLISSRRYLMPQADTCPELGRRDEVQLLVGKAVVRRQHPVVHLNRGYPNFYVYTVPRRAELPRW